MVGWVNQVHSVHWVFGLVSVCSKLMETKVWRVLRAWAKVIWVRVELGNLLWRLLTVVVAMVEAENHLSLVVGVVLEV